jgi:NitT/TauT family transport system substrate-binding protein
MGRGNLSDRLATPAEVASVPYRPRREFVKGLGGLAGSVALLGYDLGLANAEPPPEITRLRIHENEITCVAAQIIAQELLYAEGFTDVQYVNFPRDIQLWPPEDLLAGQVDITLSFAPTDIRFLDAGAPIAILAAAHNGCVELVASNRIRSTRDLKGKNVGAEVTDAKIFISMFAAYVGVDPEKDINWVSYPFAEWLPLFTQGKIEAFMTGPPRSLELRQKGIGHVLVNTTTDKPWSQYACCLVASTKEFVRKYPVATKRALRAILKGVDLCATDPSRVARLWADRGLGSYELTLRGLRELPFGKWREIDVIDSLRFWALRMRDVGAIKSSPQKLIAEGTDLRFLNELKRELKA